MKPSHLTLADPHAEALEARAALRLAAELNRGTQALPHDIGERLRIAREGAVQRAAATRRAAAAAVAVQSQGSGTAALSGPPSLWLRFASFMPILVLLAGLVVIQQRQDAEQVSAAAEVDTALLADELPPAAYSDPGFAEFLKTAPPQP